MLLFYNPIPDTFLVEQVSGAVRGQVWAHVSVVVFSVEHWPLMASSLTTKKIQQF